MRIKVELDVQLHEVECSDADSVAWEGTVHDAEGRVLQAMKLVLPRDVAGETDFKEWLVQFATRCVYRDIGENKAAADTLAAWREGALN